MGSSCSSTGHVAKETPPRLPSATTAPEEVTAQRSLQHVPDSQTQSRCDHATFVNVGAGAVESSSPKLQPLRASLMMGNDLVLTGSTSERSAAFSSGGGTLGNKKSSQTDTHQSSFTVGSGPLSIHSGSTVRSVKVSIPLPLEEEEKAIARSLCALPNGGSPIERDLSQFVSFNSVGSGVATATGGGAHCSSASVQWTQQLESSLQLDCCRERLSDTNLTCNNDGSASHSCYRCYQQQPQQPQSFYSYSTKSRGMTPTDAAAVLPRAVESDHSTNVSSSPSSPLSLTSAC